MRTANKPHLLLKQTSPTGAKYDHAEAILYILFLWTVSNDDFERTSYGINTSIPRVFADARVNRYSGVGNKKKSNKPNV